MVREEFISLINDNLILQWIESNITNFSPRQAALVLGRVILWVVFDEETSKIIHPNIVDRIKTLVWATDVRQELGRSNPVEKIYK